MADAPPDKKLSGSISEKSRGGPGTGTISLILGPMFSGKTTRMIDSCRRWAYTGRTILVIKYAKDCRYAESQQQGACLSSHSDIRQASEEGNARASAIRVEAALTLSGVAAVSEEVIGIDEGQFYPDLVEYCARWAAEGRHVIVAALDGDFLQRPFGRTLELVPQSEEVTKLRGICMRCRDREAAFTHRLGGSTALMEIGAAEAYETLCRACLPTQC